MVREAPSRGHNLKSEGVEGVSRTVSVLNCDIYGILLLYLTLSHDNNFNSKHRGLPLPKTGAAQVNDRPRQQER